MGEYKYSISSNPLYIHNNLDHFHNNLEANYIKIENKGKQILSKSIELQKKKESYFYKALNLNNGDWKKIANKIYGPFGEENENEINKLQYFLDMFVKFIRQGVLKGADFSRKEKVAEYKKSVSTEAFENLIKEYVNIYNNPAKEFYNWYNNSEYFQTGKLTIEDAQILEKIYQNYRLKEKGMTDENGNLVLSTMAQGQKLLEKSTGIVSNMIGDISEAATVTITNEGESHIIAVGSSYWTDNKNNISADELLRKNEEFYRKVEKGINGLINKKNINIGTDDGNFHFSQKTLKTNLKADEIFYIQIEVNSKKLTVPYGISSKASWSENITDPKLHSGSFNSVLENMLKIFGEGIANSLEIIHFLKYGTINALGISMQQDMENRYTDYIKIRNLFIRLINCYGYQWLTGGISQYTHADFFSVYKNEHYYFIPMSLILEGIQNAVENNENSFLAISGTDDLKPKADTKNMLFPPRKAAISAKTLEDIGKKKIIGEVNNEMKEIANGILNSGGSNGTISLRWNRVTGII